MGTACRGGGGIHSNPHWKRKSSVLPSVFHNQIHVNLTLQRTTKISFTKNRMSSMPQFDKAVRHLIQILCSEISARNIYLLHISCSLSRRLSLRPSMDDLKARGIIKSE